MDWSDPAFIRVLLTIGQLLPHDQYTTRINLAASDKYPDVMLERCEHVVILESRANGPLLKAGSTGVQVYKKAKLEATRRLSIVQKDLRDRFKSITNILDMYSSESEDDEDAGPAEWMNVHADVHSAGESDTSAKEAPGLNPLDMYRKLRYTQDKQVSLYLMNVLHQSTHRDIRHALNNPIIMLANALAKRLSYAKKPRQSRKTTKVEPKWLLQFRRQILACKLQLPVDALVRELDFEKFARANHLHRYLYTLGHALRVEQDRIHILFQGEWCAWRDIQPSVAMQPDTMTLLGQYSHRGIVNAGVYDWTTLEPFYIEPSTWGNRYLFDICSWIIEKPRLTGDHTFIRLRTPQGEWYSVGQYRPVKMGFHEQFVFPMKIKQSKFMSPDVSEFWNGFYTVLSVEITAQDFCSMKERIEHDQANGEHTYQLFHDNCTKYAKSLGTIAQLDLPSSIPVLELIIQSKRIKDTGRRWLNADCMPHWLKPLLKRVWALAFNGLGLVLGNAIVDKELKDDPKFRDVQPFINSLHDLVNVNKVMTDHPYIIGFYVLERVKAWRKSEMQRLVESGASQDEIQGVEYRLPDEFLMQDGTSKWDTYDDRVRIWN